MILYDLTQKVVTDVYGIFAQAAGIDQPTPPDIETIRTGLAGETKRATIPAPVGNPLRAELLYIEEPNKNLIFTFAFPTDLGKELMEKAEAAQAQFDAGVQQYLVDYYL
ncbi:MAG: hypothetical protein WCV85_02470 [Patescibacteria group bacterium]|jgi:hypothetical protein